MNCIYITVIVLLCHVSSISTSDGDRSPFYINCVNKCRKDKCRPDDIRFKDEAVADLSIWVRLLWNCKDDCRYNCMWRTVDIFQERGYQLPKFHGKWPFKRIFGVQEPGSAFASLLNLATNLYMHAEIRSRFTIKSVPYVIYWHSFMAMTLNAWFWSTVFHIRDTPFTEFMDYLCAFALVMGLYVTAIIRVLHRRHMLMAIFLVGPLVYFLHYGQYLYNGIVDYDFNMRINIIFGGAGSLVWLCWALWQVHSGRRHAWRAVAFLVGSAAALSLELLDFPPKLHAWDAHALWHLATVPLPLIFYRFVIDDLYYLQASSMNEKLDLKLT